MAESTDVVIVGSGLSGLTTAYRLNQHGVKTTILEVADEIGGRTFSIQNISVGGTWGIFDDVSLVGLSHEVGCPPFAPDIEFNLKFVAPTIDMITNPYCLFKLWLIGQKICKHQHYWRSPSATKYDKMSLQQWLDTQDGFLDSDGSKHAVKEWFCLMENHPWDLSKISALFAAVSLYQRLSNITQTGPILPATLRWEGGTGKLVHAIVNKLGHTQIVTGAAANEIIQSPDDVLIVTSGPTIKSFTAKYVVMAMSPTACLNLTYIPHLPEGHRRLCEGLSCWDDPAVQLVLEFTHDIAPNVTVLPSIDARITPDSKEVFGAIMNLSHKQSTHGFFRILVDPRRIEGLSHYQIQHSAINFLSRYIDKEKLINNFIGMTIYDWRDRKPFLPAVTMYFPPNVLTAKSSTTSNHRDLLGDHLRKPFGRILWSGSERGLRGLFWMQGAVRRGNEVAAEILKSMGKIKSREKYLRNLELADKERCEVDLSDCIEDKIEDVVEDIGDTISDIFSRDMSVSKSRSILSSLQECPYRENQLTPYEAKILTKIRKYQVTKEK
jgi:monoamine oxidase